jgi:anti-sigma-K factor RskA
MNPQDDLRDLFELYALGVLEEPERSQVEEALRTGSPEMLARLRQAMETNAMLTAQVPLAKPPAKLRGRILASVGAPRQSGFQWLWVVVATAAAALIGVVYLGNQSQQRGRELAQLRTELQSTLEQQARANVELTRVRHVLRLLNEAETRLISFGPDEPKPRGRVLLNPSRGVVLIASNLPPAPAGRIYEMWILKDGKASAAGLFQSQPNGTALHIQETPVTLDTKVAVTLEPESGSAQPTSTPLFVAGL